MIMLYEEDPEATAEPVTMQYVTVPSRLSLVCPIPEFHQSLTERPRKLCFSHKDPAALSEGSGLRTARIRS
jgi:hypothetical protein